MIKVSAPALIGNEKKYVDDAINKGDIAIGEYIDRFEQWWAEHTGSRFAVSCNSGTSALILALKAIGVGPGDEVIIPDLTYIATANAVYYFGATPVFVDIDPVTWCIDPLEVASAITKRTKAIIPVHIYGHPADILGIGDAIDYSVDIIEDAAEAHGATYRGLPVGSMGTAGCFSFYGNKIITTGEGGLLVTNRESIQSHARDYRDGFTHGEFKYEHAGIGFNFRMSNLTAAFGLGQSEQLAFHLEYRAKLARWYDELLPKHLGIHTQGVAGWASPSNWMVTIVLDEKYNRDNVAAGLAEKGIETRPTFVPMHRQSPYAMYSGGKLFPVTDKVADYGLNLPTHLHVSYENVEYICKSLEEVLS